MWILNPASLVIGDRSWIVPAALIAVLGLTWIFWQNRQRLRAGSAGPWLRSAAWLLLAICLLNPLWSGQRPRSGANVIAVVSDISRSHLVSASAGGSTRAEEFQQVLKAGESTTPPGWLKRLEQDFELRRYTVAERLLQVDRLDAVEFQGTASSLNSALKSLQQRYEGQPLAGVLLLTDGNATDAAIDPQLLKTMPPIYPVVPATETTLPDVGVGTWSVTQTAFDDAPVTIQVLPQVSGFAQGQIAVSLCDATGVLLERQTMAPTDTVPLRFRHRPTQGGTVFYQLRVALVDSQGAEVAEEATLVNNVQLIAVERGTAARRILYVSGRPNWDFKFLRRAVESDPLLEIVALIRIARKEAKFDFRGRDGESSNSLFRGFDKADPETVEEYDEPVLVRLNTKSDEELRSGFPQQAEELFQYDGLVVDDLEADFFTADQMTLIYDFVSRRGGGLLMMGGQESLSQGDFARTPVGELLPVDVGRRMQFPEAGVRLRLTRDGWLQPWIRLRPDESGEEQRLGEMPEFLTINPAGYVRPGAVVMAEVEDSAGVQWPALVVQRFGRGRTGALCIGDLWRWRLSEGLKSLQQPEVPTATAAESVSTEKAGDDLSDHARACRQMMRWLVADVPRRLEVGATEDTESGSSGMKLTAVVRGSDFEVSENADVRFSVTAPDGQVFELTGVPSDTESGTFEATLVAAQEGGWQMSVKAVVSDDAKAEPLTAVAGWASQPNQKEMQSVRINRSGLEDLATQTGGRVLELDEIEDLVSALPQSQAPLTEFWSWPVWHSWWVFLIIVGCLTADWTMRRRGGLP